MNLSIFFEPLSEELSEQIAHNTLGETVHRFTTKFPDWRQANIALIGVKDWRGSLAG